LSPFPCNEGIPLLLIVCIILMVPFSMQQSYLDSVFLVPNLVRLANQAAFNVYSLMDVLQPCALFLHY
jgi:hypothetical protein